MRRRPVDLRKGIFILPNLFTSGGLLCGFASIVSSIQGKFDQAAWLVLASHIFDGLDGRVARFTHSTSRFGVEYDSLADLVSFGMAPAVLMFSWALHDYGKWGWLAAFFFLTCGALRLARFNVQSGTIENKWFVGLPIPAAADVVVMTVLLFYYLGWQTDVIRPRVMLGAMFALSFLMVSTVRYWSLKNLNFQQKQSVWILVGLVALGALAVAETEPVLFAVASLYAISGPILFLLEKLGLLGRFQGAKAGGHGGAQPGTIGPGPDPAAGERRPYFVIPGAKRAGAGGGGRGIPPGGAGPGREGEGEP